MSSVSSVNDALAGYAAGRLTAEQLVGVVAAAYYGEQGARSRQRLKPLMEIIERAHPGVTELSATASRPGFEVRLTERPFPKRYEAEFRQGVQALLVEGVSVKEVGAQLGVWSRIIRAVRRLFTAST